MRPSNVFLLGLDDFHHRQLRSLRNADDYRFFELYRKEDVKSGNEDVAERVLNGANRILDQFTDPIDAIVSYWDFPASTMLPLLRQRRDLPTPSFESVLKCEHKYWCRLEQRQVISDHIPEFCVFDPFANDAADKIQLDYPFWIKPVKSVLSYLGFRIQNHAELDSALRIIRAGIDRIATPFNYLLQFADLPREVAAIDGRHCIAESIISTNRQVTLEGYALGEEIVFYGGVDSVREGLHKSSFNRYQYPTTLPVAVLDRMYSVSRRFLSHIGFTNSPFNIEFYWDDATDQIYLLEINTRISKSHAPLFKFVDGEYHHRIMLDVAIGRHPEFPRGHGKYRIAAKFMWRVYEDAVVARAPTREELIRLSERIPGMDIELHITEGTRLSNLPYQDSYSYELAAIFLGGDDEAEILSKYAECQSVMNVQLKSASG